MTPDQQQNMRAQLADYTKTEFIDLAISLQDVIDEHVTEKRSLQASIDAMSVQLPALRAELEKYEGGEVADPEELAEKDRQIAELRTKYEELRDRFDKVQALNEKFQEKLLDAV